MVEKREQNYFWVIGKYKGETFIGRYWEEKGDNKLTGVLASGRAVCIPREKATGVKKLKIMSEPSPFKITAELQDKYKKTEAEQSIEILLNHLNTY